MYNNCQVVHRPQNCLNNKRAFSKACRLCIDACPHQAIAEDREIDSRKCTECGACMAVCPSDGFVDRNIDALIYYIDNADSVILNCPQAQPLGYEIPCMGIMDRDLWISLMLAADKREVRIHTGLCAQCLDKKACSLSVKAFKNVHDAWSDHPPIIIHVSPDRGEKVESAVKIDDIFKKQEKGGWKEKGWNKIEEVLPGVTRDEAYDVPKSKQFLRKQLVHNQGMKIPYPALVVNDQCTSCGVCAAICPQKALTKREEGAKMFLVYEPYKCVGCKRCSSICRPEALSFSTKSLSHKMFSGKIRIHEGSPLHCERCGKQVFDRTEPLLCVACATSDPNYQGGIW